MEITLETKKSLELPEVAFACVHNSCCSQVEEALVRQLAADVVGSKEKEAVELALPEMRAEIRQIYHQTQKGSGQR